MTMINSLSLKRSPFVCCLAICSLVTAISAQTQSKRFGIRYISGRVELKPFDGGLIVAEDRVIVLRAKGRKNDVEEFAIPFASIKSAESAMPNEIIGFTKETVDREYVTIVTQTNTGAGALVFQVSWKEGADIVAKINFGIEQVRNGGQESAIQPAQILPANRSQWPVARRAGTIYVQPTDDGFQTYIVAGHH